MIDGLYKRAVSEIEDALGRRERSIDITTRADDFNNPDVKQTLSAVRQRIGYGAPIRINFKPAQPQSPYFQERQLIERIEGELNCPDEVFLSLRARDRLHRLPGGRFLDTCIADAAENAGVIVTLDTPIMNLPQPGPGARIHDQLQFWASLRKGVVPNILLERLFQPNPRLKPEYTPQPGDEEIPPNFDSPLGLSQGDLAIFSYWKNLHSQNARKLVSAALGWVDQVFPAPGGTASYRNGSRLAVANITPAERTDFRQNSKIPQETIGWQSPTYLEAEREDYTHLMVHKVPSY